MLGSKKIIAFVATTDAKKAGSFMKMYWVCALSAMIHSPW